MPYKSQSVSFISMEERTVANTQRNRSYIVKPPDIIATFLIKNIYNRDKFCQSGYYSRKELPVSIISYLVKINNLYLTGHQQMLSEEQEHSKQLFQLELEDTTCFILRKIKTTRILKGIGICKQWGLIIRSIKSYQYGVNGSKSHTAQIIPTIMLAF